MNTKTDLNSIESSLKNIELLLNYSKAVYNEDSVETGINTFIKQQSKYIRWPLKC